MARIYRAWDDVAKKDVAIKRLYPYFVANEIVRKRFISEGKIQQILDHPNIVRVIEIIEKPMLAIVMELVDGETLDEHLARRGSLEEAQVLDLLLPILSAVGFAHKRGIIHRDIKPSNILISRQPPFALKIMDFGVAKIKGKEGTNLTATGTTVGTLHYMSPEQIVGSKNIDGRADIYSLGVTVYKLITGEVPFNAPTEFALMMAQVEAAPLPPSQLKPNLSKDLEKIILRAMAKKADDRFQTIREFTNALLQANLALANNETINDRISVEALQFAMDADQVGQDMTGEIDFLSTSFPAALGADTQEQTRKVKSIPNPNDSPEPTQELSAAQLISMSNIDLMIGEVEDTIEYNKLDASIADTVALKARVNLKSRARIVFDQAESQDLTAPKISQEIYDQVLRNADKATFEEPNFRQENPQLFSSPNAPTYNSENSIAPVKSTSRLHPLPRPTPNPQLSQSFPNSPQQKKGSGFNAHEGSGQILHKQGSGFNQKGSGFSPQASGFNQNYREGSGQNSSDLGPRIGSGFNQNAHPNSGLNTPQPNPQNSSNLQRGFRTIPEKNIPTIPPQGGMRKLEKAKEGLDIKVVFAIAAAFGMVVIALTFLIFTIFF